MTVSGRYYLYLFKKADNRYPKYAVKFLKFAARALPRYKDYLAVEE